MNEDKYKILDGGKVNSFIIDEFGQWNPNPKIWNPISNSELIRQHAQLESKKEFPAYSLFEGATDNAPDMRLMKTRKEDSVYGC